MRELAPGANVLFNLVSAAHKSRCTLPFPLGCACTLTPTRSRSESDGRVHAVTHSVTVVHNFPGHNVMLECGHNNNNTCRMSARRDKSHMTPHYNAARWLCGIKQFLPWFLYVGGTQRAVNCKPHALVNGQISADCVCFSCVLRVWSVRANFAVRLILRTKPLP